MRTSHFELLWPGLPSLFLILFDSGDLGNRRIQWWFGLRSALIVVFRLLAVCLFSEPLQLKSQQLQRIRLNQKLLKAPPPQLLLRRLLFDFLDLENFY